MASNPKSNAPVKAAAITENKHSGDGAGAPPPSPRTSSGHLISSSVAQSPRKTPPPSPGITLLDVHEIKWIMTKLEHLINSSSSSSFSVPFPDEGPGDLRTVGRKNSFRKGFGSRFGRHATSLCGSDMEAVVETTRKRHAKQG